MSPKDAKRIAEECQRENLAALASFGECPYVKVLIYIYLFEEYEGCQLFLPGTLRRLLGTLRGYRRGDACWVNV
jgi:hypothetical protein